MLARTSSVVNSPVMAPRWERAERRSWAMSSVERVVSRALRTAVRSWRAAVSSE